jgi:hypothetical protein
VVQNMKGSLLRGTAGPPAPSCSSRTSPSAWSRLGAAVREARRPRHPRRGHRPRDQQSDRDHLLADRDHAARRVGPAAPEVMEDLRVLHRHAQRVARTQGSVLLSAGAGEGRGPRDLNTPSRTRSPRREADGQGGLP